MKEQHHPDSHRLTPFLFGENTVRTITLQDQSWFVNVDVCTILSLDNPRQAISFLEDDEKGVITTDTLGGPQQISIISEMGLYRLIFKSRKAAALAFQRWVFHEVLPAIRRSGAYSPGQVSFVGFVRELIGLGCSPDASLRAAMRQSPVRSPQVMAEAAPALSPMAEDALFIVSLMEPGREYPIADLYELVPRDSALAKKFKGMGEASRYKKLGWIMREATKRGLADKGGNVRKSTFIRPLPESNIIAIDG